MTKLDCIKIKLPHDDNEFFEEHIKKKNQDLNYFWESTLLIL